MKINFFVSKEIRISWYQIESNISARIYTCQEYPGITLAQKVNLFCSKRKKIDIIIIIIIRIEKWNFEKPNLLLKQIDRQSLCRSHNSYAAAAVGSSRFTLLRWSKVFLYGASWHIICTQWNIFLLQSVHESTETCDFASIRVAYICRYAYSRTCS